jgi:23S rRNA G2445 N2-methylase RlmL
MIQFTAQVPDALFKQVEALAARENLSIDQLVAIALTSQVSAWSAQEYLQERAKRGSWEKVQQVLAKVPEVEPEAEDRL